MLHVVTFRFDSAENELPEVEILTILAIDDLVTNKVTANIAKITGLVQSRFRGDAELRTCAAGCRSAGEVCLAAQVRRRINE